MPVEPKPNEATEECLEALQFVGMKAQCLQMELMEQVVNAEDFSEMMNAPVADVQMVRAAIQMAEQVHIPLPEGHLPVGSVRFVNGELIYLLKSIVDRAMELSAQYSRQPDKGYAGPLLKS